MPVADVVDVVAVEIHVAPARDVLHPDPFGFGDRVEAGRRDRLAQEAAFVTGEQRPGRPVERAGLPGRAAVGEVRVAFGFGDQPGFRGHRVLQRWSRPKTKRFRSTCRSFTPMAVAMMTVAIAAADATAPASSMCTIEIEASLVSAP